MTSDPRLRLLGAATSGGQSALADAVLARLDETEVVVAVHPDADPPARVAVAAFVTIIARLVPHVSVESHSDLPANWWRATSWGDLLERLTAVRPTASAKAVRQVKVSFGGAERGSDLYVGGGDWNVLLGTAPVLLEQGNLHALGVHAAACLTVSQVLMRVLGELGFPGVALSDAQGVSSRIETNLVDHSLRSLGEQTSPVPLDPCERPLGFLGVGSVGTSAMALLATVCSPLLNPTLASMRTPQITAVDNDVFDPERNPYRYPALTGGESDHKATAIVARLKELGLPSEAVVADVASWNSTKREPGWRGVVISSVDTLSGRLDVADVLAEHTLSAGVSGTELHVQWEQFADGFACPFCDYVRATPPLTQAGAFAQVTGIALPRVLALLQEGSVLSCSDVDAAVAASRVDAHRRDALIGARLSDLVRQAYAEAEFRPSTNADGSATDVVAVASPQVSWFAGTLIVAELIKDMSGLPKVGRRVDLDVGGLPAGVVRRVPADSTGSCVCHSGVRRRWYRAMYGPPAEQPEQDVGAVASPTPSS